MGLEPIVHEYHLPCSADQAFDIYANSIGAWWHPDYSANPATFLSLTIEPRVGGPVVAQQSGLDDQIWGTVTVWAPPRRLAYESTLAQSQQHPSTITVTFDPADDGCHVRFEHGGWNEANSADRGKFSDWPVILDRFADLAGSKFGRAS